MEADFTRSFRAVAAIGAALALASTPALAQEARSPPPGPSATASVVPTEDRKGTAADGALAGGNAFPPPVPAPAETVAVPPVDRGVGGFPAEAALGLVLVLIAAVAGVLRIRSRRRGRTAESGAIDDTYAYDPVTWTPVPRETLVEPASGIAEEAPASAAEERRELLESMVAAPPDKDNPFTSRKARMRRARILLRREQRQRQEKRFDWRNYRTPAGPTAPAVSDKVEV